MYLHINKNCVIKSNEIIGIFSMASIKDTKEFSDLCENINEIVDLSDGNSKTFILTKEKGILKGYILKLSVNIIEKRNKTKEREEEKWKNLSTSITQTKFKC